MPVLLLEPKTYFQIRFPVPRRGFTRRGLIDLKVESTLPVDTYIFDEAGRDNFASGQKFYHYGGFRQQEQHRQEIRLPFQGYFYLVINNPNNQPAAVYYDVTG